MCIYCGTNRYRKIYEYHHGKIPIDQHGKKFHIHHLDGNHKNNKSENLIALSEEDHYKKHLEQGDFGAASRLAKRRFVSSEERTMLARQSMINRISDQNYINPSTIESVRVKQSNSAKLAWRADDGTRKQLVIGSMNSNSAKQKKIETWNKKSPIYHLKNLNTGMEVKMTRYDFIHKFFNGRLTNFNDIVPDKETGKSRRLTVRGWKFLGLVQSNNHGSLSVSL